MGLLLLFIIYYYTTKQYEFNQEKIRKFLAVARALDGWGKSDYKKYHSPAKKIGRSLSRRAKFYLAPSSALMLRFNAATFSLAVFLFPYP